MHFEYTYSHNINFLSRLSLVFRQNKKLKNNRFDVWIIKIRRFDQNIKTKVHNPLCVGPDGRTNLVLKYWLQIMV